jgi:N-acetylneuraminic acid mutarotase
MLNSGGVYDPATDTWSAMTTVGAPLPTRCHAAVWTGDEMIVFGGQHDAALGCGLASINTGKRFDPATDTWIAMADAPFSSSLGGPAAVWSGSRMITWFDHMGGRYAPVANAWQGVSTDNAPSQRTGHTSVWTGSKMIVWGGAFAGVIGTGAVYDPSFDNTP